MQHNVAFHHELHCLLRLKQFSGTEIHHNLENSTCDLFTYMYLLYQYIWEDPSEYKGLLNSSIGPVKQKIGRSIIIFPAQKNRLIETALLNTHTICLVEKQSKKFRLRRLI